MGWQGFDLNTPLWVRCFGQKHWLQMETECEETKNDCLSVVQISTKVKYNASECKRCIRDNSYLKKCMKMELSTFNFFISLCLIRPQPHHITSDRGAVWPNRQLAEPAPRRPASECQQSAGPEDHAQQPGPPVRGGRCPGAKRRLLQHAYQVPGECNHVPTTVTLQNGHNRAWLSSSYALNWQSGDLSQWYFR